MSRKAIVVAGLSVVAIAASGCTGDSDAEAVDISKLRAAFEESSGSETPWYGHVTGMEMAETAASLTPRLEITTDLGPDAEGSETARMICGAAVRLAFDQADEPIEITGRVLGSDGVALMQCA